MSTSRSALLLAIILAGCARSDILDCSGCVVDGLCVAGRSIDACGTNGAACVACTCPGDQCVDGACTPVEPVETFDIGGGNICATTESGIWCWGDSELLSGVPVPQLFDAGAWSRVDLASRHACAIRDDGTLWCWGNNVYDQLGTTTPLPHQTTPFRVDGSNDWATVWAVHAHTFGQRANGELYAWGGNTELELGLGHANPVATPTRAPFGDGWKDIVGEGPYHHCGLSANDDLWCWGANWEYAVGETTPPPSATRTPGLLTAPGPWRHTDSGVGVTCAAQTSGSLWCWGTNDCSQLGAGLINTRSLVLIDNLRDWRFVAVGGHMNAGCSHSCAIDSTGALFCWGRNENGQLGTGDNQTRAEPTRVTGGQVWEEVAANFETTCGLTAAGALWCWGDNASSQLGNGDTRARNTPTRVCLGP